MKPSRSWWSHLKKAPAIRSSGWCRSPSSIKHESFHNHINTVSNLANLSSYAGRKCHEQLCWQEVPWAPDLSILLSILRVLIQILLGEIIQRGLEHLPHTDPPGADHPKGFRSSPPSLSRSKLQIPVSSVKNDNLFLLYSNSYFCISVWMFMKYSKIINYGLFRWEKKKWRVKGLFIMKLFTDK